MKANSGTGNAGRAVNLSGASDLTEGIAGGTWATFPRWGVGPATLSDGAAMTEAGHTA